MIRKAAISLFMGIIMPTVSLMAQQLAPLKPVQVAPFSGSLYVQGFMQEDPKKEYKKENGMVEFRISIDGSKIAIDSVLEMSKRTNGMKVVFDASAKTLTVCEGLRYYDNIKRGFIIDLSDKKTKYKASQDSQSEAFKMVTNPDYKVKYSVTDQVQQISEFTCRKVLAENNMVSMELWVTDQMGLKISDFDKVFKVTKDLDGTFQLYAMVGSLPDALKNSFPVRIIAREKAFKKYRYDESATNKKKYRPSVMMLNVVKVDHTIDPKIFDLKGYALSKKRPFEIEENEEPPVNNIATDRDSTEKTVAPINQNADGDNTPAPSAPDNVKPTQQPAENPKAPVLLTR